MGGFVNIAQMLSRKAQALPRAGQRPSQAGSVIPSSNFPEGFDPTAANEALAPYGLQEPQHANPFVMFNDQSGLGANHPKLARFIEGALMGAQTPSGDTVGENIGNVARSVMNVPNAYRQNEMNQFMAPFQMAAPMAQLQGASDAHNLSQAHAAYFDSEAAKNGQPQPDEYANITTALDPNGKPVRVGTNKRTGKMEQVPGSEGFNFQNPNDSKDAYEQQLNKRLLAPPPSALPIPPSNPKDATAMAGYQGQMENWLQNPDNAKWYNDRKAAKDEEKLYMNHRTDPGVARAVAGANARPVIIMTPNGPTYTPAGNAMGKSATPANAGTVKDLVTYQASVGGFENALNNVDNSLDVLKDADRRPLITAALKHAATDEGFFSQLLTGAARTMLKPKEVMFVTSVLRARELANGLRPFSGNARSTETMTQRFIEGSIPEGASGYDFAKKLVAGTRQEVNIIKDSVNKNYKMNVLPNAFVPPDQSGNMMAPFATRNDDIDAEIEAFNQKKGVK